MDFGCNQLIKPVSVEYPLLINPNGGNVGIGTTVASSLLHFVAPVQGSQQIDGIRVREIQQ